MPQLPVACFECPRCSPVRRHEHGREIAVFDARPIFSAPPNSAAYFVEVIHLLIRQRVGLSTFAINNVNGFDRPGIRHCQIAESAKPREASGDGLAVVFRDDLRLYDIALVKMKALGDFQVAVAPRETQISWCRDLIAPGRYKQRGVCGAFQLWIIQHHRERPAAYFLRSFRMNQVEHLARL